MNGLLKSGAVLVGYVIAVLVASAAVDIRIAHTSGPDAQASAGMYAFGDGMLFLAVFGTLALLPSGMVFFFLRPYRLFWIMLSIVASILAASALAAASIYVSASYLAVPGSIFELGAALAVLRMLLSPLLAAFFLLSGIFSPDRMPRWTLLIAAGIEGAVAAFAVLHWFVSCCFI